MTKNIYITVTHEDNPNYTFYIKSVLIDDAFNTDWSITPNMDHALEVDTVDKARAAIACIKSSGTIKGYTFKIMELVLHD